MLYVYLAYENQKFNRSFNHARMHRVVKFQDKPSNSCSGNKVQQFSCI